MWWLYSPIIPPSSLGLPVGSPSPCGLGVRVRLPAPATLGTATADDNPVDLTGYAAEAQVRRQPRGANVILDLNPSVTTPLTGEVTIPSISSTDTSAITSYGKFYWDLVFKNSGTGERLGPFVAGSFTISDTITQEGAAPPEL